jgi:hypothetical protein
MKSEGNLKKRKNMINKKNHKLKAMNKLHNQIVSLSKIKSKTNQFPTNLYKIHKLIFQNLSLKNNPFPKLMTNNTLPTTKTH